MSCCCCQGLEWCAKFCCAGLNKQRESTYVGIQYSHVPIAKLFPNRPITEQPSGKDLQLADVRSSSHIGDLCHVSSKFQSLTMYREKAIDLTKDAIVQFSLQYDTHQSKLRVDLQYASNLMGFCNGDPIQCDPLVKLHLEPDNEETFQSKIIKGTQNPVFNQIFQFGGLLIDYMKLQTLVFRFYNHALSNKLIGKACLQLCNVDLLGVVVQIKIIHNEKKEV